LYKYITSFHLAFASHVSDAPRGLDQRMSKSSKCQIDKQQKKKTPEKKKKKE
jgi:hypothetical protein